jgi:eukaryotic-like serine/threonine-protein kinase
MHKISTEDWRAVFGLLDTALELPAAARTAWLDSLADAPHIVAALRELLSRNTAEEFMRQLPQFTGSPETQHGAAESAAAGGIVGPYRLIHRVGRGGMSSVWMAERVDGSPRRRVAIKLPHVSWALPELTRRMARERDILASLEHPNIARLYDAGVADDGRPYLALELVDGLPVDEYCEKRRASVATRVGLTLQTAPSSSTSCCAARCRARRGFAAGWRTRPRPMSSRRRRARCRVMRRARVSCAATSTPSCRRR